MHKIKVLVFPCGSEVGLEIHRSLKYSRHIELWGGNSTNDHGRFQYENYIGDIPYITSDKFEEHIKELVEKYDFDVIYPAMDSVVAYLKSIESKLGCKVIASPEPTSTYCGSKKLTFDKLNGKVKLPQIFESLDEVKEYPIFMKPDIGYGSKGASKIGSENEGIEHLKSWTNSLICEYLPGEEYTIDCFTDKNQKLLFVGPRIRNRMRSGIAVNTESLPKTERKPFEEIANTINSVFELRGAWFFQVKRDRFGELTLLEVASRLGGSSILYRLKGVNFALLSVFDALDFDVQITENSFEIEVDRALDHKAKINYEFDSIYIDFDDCIYINGLVNYELVGQVYKYINHGKSIYLITKHASDLEQKLKELRLNGLFDKIIHLKSNEKKSDFINPKKAIFIDDSFAERFDVSTNLNIPTFSPDSIMF